METIGIITYHSAYNYGSVLQAYATQSAVKKLGLDSEIINYRMKEQRKVYALYRTGFGLKRFIKDVMQIPVHNKRKQRKEKFESFINSKLVLSKELSRPDEVYYLWGKYPIIISGSDQIWNKHSLEMEHNDLKYMDPYLLKGFGGKKISYASSIANMSDQELDGIIPEIKQFDYIAMRERSSAHRVSSAINRNVDHVVDPTFLLTKDEWVKALDVRELMDDYILYYSLDGIKTVKDDITVIKKIAKMRGLKVKVITPFVYLNHNDDIIEVHPEIGPEEFLELIYNAKMVVTDSYHGTILSINLEKEVFSTCKKGGSEFRKTDILNRIGLEDRIIYDTSDLNNEYVSIDYKKVMSKLNILRENSWKYLEGALGDDNM